jgi:molybdenum cofactor synthesis domain-containing protein
MAKEPVSYGCAVVTISTGCAEGWREDTSGLAAQQILSTAGFHIEATAIVPDDLLAISEIVTRWTDILDIPLIVSSGGTGLTPTDITPEATRPLLQREILGISEAMRMRTLEKTPMAMISRGVAGVRGRSLIVNLPGSPHAVRECLDVVLPVLQHAIALIRQDPTDH